jgi:mono/diheme cytochrome c family protein
MTNKANWISLGALLVLVIALPVYGLFESGRMVRAEIDMRNQYLNDAIGLYIQNCANCHGADGVGIGIMPDLNRPALAQAQSDLLFKTIARAAHGATMAAWHIEEGGILTDYQVEELVALIQYADWVEVKRMADAAGFVKPSAPVVEMGLSYLASEEASDPHQCIDCHEEPILHANSFGINCGRCHNTLAWTPAALTRHDFLLDHGGEGEVSCETCHPASYVEYDCYTCHTDHQAAEMETVHQAEQIFEFADCARCHPTGAAGEADKLRETPSESDDETAMKDLLTFVGASR